MSAIGGKADIRQARHTSLPDYNYRHLVGQSIERRLVPARSGLAPSRRSKPLKELKLTTFNARAENEQTHCGDRLRANAKLCVLM